MALKLTIFVSPGKESPATGKGALLISENFPQLVPVQRQSHHPMNAYDLPQLGILIVNDHYANHRVDITGETLLHGSVNAPSVAAVTTRSAAQVNELPAFATLVNAPAASHNTTSKVVTSSAVHLKTSSSVSITTSKSATASSTSASTSTSATSSPACVIKRAGTAGATAAADCGTCDPCDDSCDSNTHEFSTRRRRTVEEAADAAGLRVVYGNETTPFLSDEGVRVRLIEGRANPQLEFDCSAGTKNSGICQNICYGIKCRTHPSTLTRNNGDRNVCLAARENNSCGSSKPDRCSVKKGFTAGHSCDEYPFASTLEGQRAGIGNAPSAVTRCVGQSENLSQGGQIKVFYGRMSATQKQFDVFLNFGPGLTVGATGYCQATGPTHSACASLDAASLQQNN
ncbi:hypothetical protein EVG20_g6856 [Dentipellis fragilis]|uniref:Deoxyribonuclease NucA/NucB domain-containing protein n=1 Tax=Dentipellis fragilis TaxID=205917 RepID=A0A4Y9YI07_9AGAM|nr:hypothetical protein EVG20_g6856 [Dentipellis fragilis]